MKTLFDLSRRRRIGRLTALAAATAIVAASAGLFAPAASAQPVALDGLFALDGGVCSGGSVTGSFFRMILPAGSTNGPFLSNSDSGCSDKTVTPLAAGTDGGLTSGTYQAQPAQAFDGSGNAVSGRVTRPVKFYGVGFATATNPTDPQTGSAAALPQLRADGTSLTGDLSSFGVTWNKQVFNQGAPKPGGGLPGKTSAVRGTIDRTTGAFVIEWTSQIVGGPFNNFTGLWHLAGTYRGSGLGGAPAAAAPAPASAAPAPGAPAPTPAAAAPAPGTPAPASGGATPAAAPAAVSGDPALAAKTIEVSDSSSPRWLLPLLVVVTAIATALLTNADRLFRRRSAR
ncbi:hypothetical protein ACQ7HM_00055 [Williamsia sp. MIQD14]|uniref:hypothetical protein n=1 Tax=Williamsia sp. MIQD14 TaxID=3425703 RepID=UPI003DA10799